MTTLPKNIDHPCYHNDNAARIMLEAIFWPNGPTCPTCHRIDTVIEHGGKKSMGPGWYWCRECRENFTVRVGSVLGRSHIQLHKWLLGFRLYAASKKGFSAHQLMRTIGLGSYRSAWFMAHRIREAMDGSADNVARSEAKARLSKSMKPISAPRSAPNGRSSMTSAGYALAAASK